MKNVIRIDNHCVCDTWIVLSLQITTNHLNYGTEFYLKHQRFSKNIHDYTSNLISLIDICIDEYIDKIYYSNKYIAYLFGDF